MRTHFESILLLSLAACAAAPSDSAAAAGVRPWDAPPLARATVVRDAHSGRRLELEELFDELAEADAVFLGEEHTDETTHRVELAVYEGLLARRGDRVVLAMEMFQHDAQPLLDDYLAGRIDEATFLEGAEPWGNYWAAYRPLIERARAGGPGIERARAGGPGLRVIGSNYPRSLTRKVAMGGADALAALDESERALVPAELLANSTAYHRRVDNAIRGHIGMMGPRDPDDPRLYTTQTLWDNAMGEACAKVLDERPGNSVLHVNGGFHSAYRDGTVRQLLLRRPATRVATVMMVACADPAVETVGDVPSADYVVFCERRATDVESGEHAVHVLRELKYRLHLPAAAKGGEPVPLVIWLCDDGLTARDGLDLWVDRLGDEAAVLAFEAPYQETQEDLGVGGRWFWPESFPEDIGAMVDSVERGWGYVLRHYAIDPSRVCLAGEGTGATVVAAVSLLTERIDHRAVAFAPRHYAKIKDFPLPLPEYRGPPPAKELRVIAGGEDADWWRGELDEYTGIGFANRLDAPADDPWESALANENALRLAVGLPAREAPAGGKRHVLLVGDTPRARQWARLRAARISARESAPVAVVDSEPLTDESTPMPIALAPDDAATREALPRCPGPFGGTTVLVVPAGADDAEVAAWQALEEDDPIAAASRFHRLRVATAEGEHGLAAVLATLEGQGRMNVLICPLEFCAPAATMRGLRAATRAFEDRMTLHWLPGLGGGLR